MLQNASMDYSTINKEQHSYYGVNDHYWLGHTSACAHTDTCIQIMRQTERGEGKEGDRESEP
jgi:hypothetical protein